MYRIVCFTTARVCRQESTDLSLLGYFNVEQEALLLQMNRATRYVSWNIMAVFDWAIDKNLC